MSETPTRIPPHPGVVDLQDNYEVTPHFTFGELKDREGHVMPARPYENLVWLCLYKLEPIRKAFGGPLRITSAYRAPQHSAERGKKHGPGAHTRGLAVDIRVYGHHARRLVRIALDHDVMGLFIKQHGPHDRRFVHLDWWEGDENRPRPWLGTYSK